MRRRLLTWSLLCTILCVGCATEPPPGSLEIVLLTAQGPSPFEGAKYVRMRVDGGESRTWPLTPEGVLMDRAMDAEADGHYHQLLVEGLDGDHQVVSRGVSPPVQFLPGTRARLRVVPRPVDRFSATLTGLLAPRVDFGLAADPAYGAWVIGGLDGLDQTRIVEHVTPWLGEVLAAPDIPEARRAPVAAVTSHGAVVVAFGDRNDAVYLRPGAEHWARTWGTDDIAAVRSAALASVGADTWLAAGGIDANGNATAQTVRLTWADDQLHLHREGDLLVPRNRPVAVSVDDQVLIAGGSTQLLGEWADGRPVAGTAGAGLTAVAVEDGALLLGDGTDWIQLVTASGEVRPAGRLQTARRGPTATRLPDGRILVAGGEGADGTAEILTLHAGLWTATASVPLTQSRTHHRAAPMADGNVLLIGGFSAGSLAWLGDIYSPPR